MLLTFEIFERAKNHGKKFPKYCQTSFSGIVNWRQRTCSQHLRSRVWIVVRPTENDSTRLYKNGDISVVAAKAEPIFAAKAEPISDIWGVNIENFNI